MTYFHVQALKTAREEDIYSLYDFDRDSYAVVASDGTNGIVLSYVGGHMHHEVEAWDSRKIEDLGLTDAPAGISIWEGKYISEISEYEATTPKGRFRKPTGEELMEIVAGRCPWQVEDWYRQVQA